MALVAMAVAAVAAEPLWREEHPASVSVESSRACLVASHFDVTAWDARRSGGYVDVLEVATGSHEFLVRVHVADTEDDARDAADFLALDSRRIERQGTVVYQWGLASADQRRAIHQCIDGSRR
ncbi:MAG: hypothetical protein WD249_10640 [Gaiellaceae bacterium]